MADTPHTQKNVQFYSKWGTVKEAVVLVDKKGNSKGYGFVTFANAKEALNAVQVEKRKIDGRVTHCNLAWIGNPKKLEGNRHINPSSRSDLNNRRLFVYSLAWKTDDATLREHFSQYGDIQEAVVIRDKKTQKSKGYGEYVPLFEKKTYARKKREAHVPRSHLYVSRT